LATFVAVDQALAGADERTIVLNGKQYKDTHAIFGDENGPMGRSLPRAARALAESPGG
jgi:hypothetical protein